MKTNCDIDKIRLLLERYYEGETSRGEEKEIETFFSGTDIADIPEDMLVDRKLFSAMSELAPDATEWDIPHILTEKIDRLANQPESRRSVAKNRKWRLFIRYSGIAAAVSLLWAIVTFVPDLNERPAEHTADTGETAIPCGNDDGTDLWIAESSESGSLEMGDETEGKFIEITDPEQARRIVLEIGGLLAQNVDKTNAAILQIGNTIDNYKEITKPISE